MINRGRPLFTLALIVAFIMTFVAAYGLSYSQHSAEYRPTVTPVPTRGPEPTRAPTATPTATPTPRPTPTMGVKVTSPLTVDDVRGWCKGWKAEDCATLSLTQVGTTVTFQSPGCTGEFRIPQPNIAQMKYQKREHRDGHTIAIAQWLDPVNNIDDNILINICWAEFTRP